MDDLDRWIAALLVQLGQDRTRLATTAAICALSALLGVASMWHAPDPSVTRHMSGSLGGVTSVAVAQLPDAALDGEAAAFDDEAWVEEPAPAPRPVVPLDQLDLRVVGTAVHPLAPDRSAALLRWGELGVARSYRLGDMVEGYRVHAIAPKRITFAAPSGERWQLEVSHRIESDDSAVRVGEATAQPAQHVSDTLTLSSRVFRRLVKRGLGPSRALKPRLDADQRVTGYTLEVRSNSVAHRMGLEHGDVLVSIEGVDAHELDDPNDALRALADHDEVCLGIERAGVVTPLCYRTE